MKKYSYVDIMFRTVNVNDFCADDINFLYEERPMCELKNILYMYDSYSDFLNDCKQKEELSEDAKSYIENHYDIEKIISKW